MTDSLGRYLGDPFDPHSRIPFATSLELDEREQYPLEAHRLLDAWGLPEWYIPVSVGGRLQSFEEVFCMLRELARHDVTVALSHAITFLGALPVWIAGSATQKALAVEHIRGHRKIAFALTEREHGADLLAGEFEAKPDSGGLSVSGEKWLIGNATQSAAITLFARTRPEGGPRGFSLLFADKATLDSGSFHHLPKVPTVGLRGADLSGISFRDCAMSAKTVIGRPGSGLELALKTLQITRTLVTGLSLGAADTALRLAVDFATTRQLYRAPVFDIPHARSLLCGAFLDLMICDCVTLAAARSLQAAPGQASVWSAVTKYFVPSRVESALRDLSTVLGARFFLRSGHPWSMFQKMLRDSSIVSVFEGASAVQLHALGLQLDLLGPVPPGSGTALTGRLDAIFSLSAELPEFDPASMDLISRDGCDPVAGIPLFGELVPDDVREHHRRFIEDVCFARALGETSLQRMELAERYAKLHAAACCIGVRAYNRHLPGEFFQTGEWLSLCLARIFRVQNLEAPASVADALLNGRFPLQLSRASTKEQYV